MTPVEGTSANACLPARQKRQENHNASTEISGTLQDRLGSSYGIRSHNGPFKSPAWYAGVAT